MPVHDWTRVEAGIFHDFHVAWIAEIRRVLNDGLLPEGYYALAEQHTGQAIADVLTLHASPPSLEPLPSLPAGEGTAVAEAPPRVSRRQSVELSLHSLRRTLAVRDISGHRLIAMVEILSPANKDRPQTAEDFVDKTEAALRKGVHVLLVDLLPPGPHNPRGMHDLIWQHLDPSSGPYDLPADAPLTLASYAAAPLVEAYLEHVAPGAAFPVMPLFLHPDRYINVPLEPTYQSAYRGMPGYWRDVLDGV